MKTIGIVLVALLAAATASAVATITSTLIWTSSAARAGRRSTLPSTEGRSMTRFWPSLQPASRRPWRNASKLPDSGERYPIRATRLGGCAGALATPPAIHRASTTAAPGPPPLTHPPPPPPPPHP